MRSLVALSLVALLCPAQQPEPSVKISVTTSLVVVNVDVRDRNGKPVENLKAGDFTIFEDNKPQKISVFEYQRLETKAEPPEPVAAPKPASATPAPKAVIKPSAPGQVRYKDRRLMVLFFDFSSMPQEDQMRAQDAALKFIDTQITPADMVSVMTFSNSLQVAEDFTNDRDRLREIIKGFRIGEGSELSVDGATGDDTEGEDNGDAFTADESEFNVFNTDQKLSALETAARMLSTLPEKKALVYFSSGVSQTGMENQSQLRATINAAIRANVSFYPIDSRGLVASAPAGDSRKGSAKGSGIFSGSSQTSMRTKFNSQQETLYTLAGDTGGKALLDNNDLSLGIQQAQKDIASYYILGYYSTNAAQDGHFRRIKVKIASQPQAKLDYRSGYFASKEFKIFNSTDKERQLEEAVLLDDPVTDLPMAMEVNYFRLGTDSYFVPVALKIPGTALELAKRGNNSEAEMDFISQVRDSKGKLVGSLRDGIKVKLDDEKAGNLSRRNIQYDSGFTLPPGDYTLKFVARENVTGKMGTFGTKFTIPDASAASPWLQTSSVVWANQREPLASAIGAAEKNKKLLATHPLVQDGQKLIPSITRVYRKDQKLYVYLEVYDPALSPATKTPDITASLSVFEGRAKKFETQTIEVHDLAAKRVHAVPVEFQIPLASLKPGKYTCQVNLIDQVGRKFAFTRAPMVLIP